MNSIIVNLAVICFGTSLAMCTVFFDEKFDTADWKKTWIYSKHSGKAYGKFIRTAGNFYINPFTDKGLQTSEDNKFYAISSKFPAFSTENKMFVLQFSVKHEKKIDCAGGYVKLFNCSLDQEDMHSESPYEIMFGPDMCGPGTLKVLVILSYKGKNHSIKKDIRFYDDVLTHFYTLILRPNNTYEVLIDNQKFESGSLQDDWDFLPPKKVKNPNVENLNDWYERDFFVTDSDDKKPKDWDRTQYIPDSYSTDWNDARDGEWQDINNPEYKADPNLYIRNELCFIGLDLWQVTSGTIFDNILLTDDIEMASKAAAKATQIQEGEKKMKEQQDKEKKQFTFQTLQRYEL